MAGRLGILFKKRRRKLALAYQAGLVPKPHKIAQKRSQKIKRKKTNPA